MPYKDADKRSAYDKARDRRAYDKARYHNDPERRAYAIAKAKRARARLVARTTPQERTALMRHFPCRSPIKRRAEHIKKRYGMTIEAWEALFAAQGRCCAICKADESGWKRAWHTDHDHVTGKVRGILCHPCNRTLGRLEGRLEAFVSYLTAVA